MPKGEGVSRHALELERVPCRGDKALPAVRRMLQKVLADVEDGGQAGDDDGQDRKVPEHQPNQMDQA